MATLWNIPAPISSQLFDPICTGDDFSIVVPSPNFPEPTPPPQLHNFPLESIAKTWLSPLETLYHEAVPILTGLLFIVVVPSPNWPKLLLPQAHNVLSDFIASINKPLPADIDFHKSLPN